MISKEIRRAEREYMNMHPHNYINALVSALWVSSGHEFDDEDELWMLDNNEIVWDDGDEDDDGSEDDNGRDGGDDKSDDGDDDEPLANWKIKLCTRLPQLPLFIPEPETPTPNNRILVDYVNMFLTDDMIGNLELETNKHGTEKTGSCPNFTKAELQTYIGMYNLMGIVRLPKIDGYWRSDLHYFQIADKMSRNLFHLIHRIDLFHMMYTLYKRQIKSRSWYMCIFTIPL